MTQKKNQILFRSLQERDDKMVTTVTKMPTGMDENRSIKTFMAKTPLAE